MGLRRASLSRSVRAVFRPATCFALTLLTLAGCGDEPPPFTPEPTVDAGPALDAGADVVETPDVPVVTDRGVIPVTDRGPALDQTVIYAHSDTELFTVDPRTDAFRSVGMFRYPSGDRNNHTMTDIAVNAMGEVVGVTHDALWRIDATNASCTLIRTLPDERVFVGLTYLPAGVLDADREVLVGGTISDGTYWRIDPETGRSTMLGRFRVGSTNYILSGDIVSIAGAATYVTVRRSNASSTSNDQLATVNVNTGALTLVGDTGFDRIFGLGYWRSTLFGFTREGEFIRLASDTGRGRRVSSPAMQFSGAGVTTVAPTAPP